MLNADTYPVPIEQERLAIAMGLFNPAATPTDAQRMEAAQMVEGWVSFKRTAYWMHLQQIVERDLPQQPQQHRPERSIGMLRYNRTKQGRRTAPSKHRSRSHSKSI